MLFLIPILCLAGAFYFRIKTEQLQKMLAESQRMLACGDVAGKTAHFEKMRRIMYEGERVTKVLIVLCALLVIGYIATLVV